VSAPSRLSDSLFRKYREIVYREAGINLTAEKRELLNARLAKRLRLLEMDAADYLECIQRDAAELMRFLDAISTNHTFFFRESKSFAYIRKGFETIWCAASSSGEEPYSLMIHGRQEGLSPSVLATDISTTCLDKGRQGVYPRQSVANLPRATLTGYFQKGKGKWADHVRIKKNIRQHVRFSRFNLLKDPLPRSEFDLIFCRNVMIYFDNPTKEHVVRRLITVLRQGGYFIIGGAESLSGLDHPLKYVEPSVYHKP
jgi:chemotaxis protein methyltransferase CheR